MKWLAALVLPTFLAFGSLITSATSTSPGRYLVLIVLDGADSDYFAVPNIPHVRALVRHGTQYTQAFAGILESETPSGHAALATGSEPRYDGIPSFWWATSENVKINLFSPDRIRAGAMEKIMRDAGAPTVAGLLHKLGPQARTVALSGNKYYAADAVGGPQADVIMYFGGTSNGLFAPTYIPGHPPPRGLLSDPGLTVKNRRMPLGTIDHLAMKLAADTFNRMHQQATLINLPEFDWPLGHVDGGGLAPQRVKTLMQGFDRDLAMLQDVYRKAGVLDRTLFVLTADHGMMPLVHKVDKADLIGAVTRAGNSLASQAYTSGAYLWVNDKARARVAAENIANLHNPYIQSVYVKVWTDEGYSYQRVGSSFPRVERAGAANQYLLQSFAGSNGPDIAVLFTEGTGCEPGGQARWKSDHGGASWRAQHIPLVLAGPGIRQGYVSSSPARLIDIAPTVLQLMGVPHQGMQGIVLGDAMKSPPDWATQTQRETNKWLVPLVTALQRESQLEVSTG